MLYNESRKRNQGKATVQTNLYELLTVVNQHFNPASDQQAAGIVREMLRLGKARRLSDISLLEASRPGRSLNRPNREYYPSGYF
jgi:hypothetical protein